MNRINPVEMELLVNQFLMRFSPVVLIARTMSITIFMMFIAPKIMFGLESFSLLLMAADEWIRIYRGSDPVNIQAYFIPTILSILSLIYVQEVFS
jgi:hypothetical protein